MESVRVFFICFGIGVVLGAGVGILNIIKSLFKHNLVVDNILDCLYSIFCCIVDLFTLIEFNFGVLRLYLIVAFLLGMYIERKTLGKVFAKLLTWLYNKISKVIVTLRKTKIYKKITK